MADADTDPETDQEQPPQQGKKKRRRRGKGKPLAKQKKGRNAKKTSTPATNASSGGTRHTRSNVVTTPAPCPGTVRATAAASNHNQQLAALPDGDYNEEEDDDDDNDDDDVAEDSKKPAANLIARRMGIYYYYTFFGSPPESEDGGKNGLVVRIRDRLGLPKTSSLRQIKKTVDVIRMYEAQKKQYKGEHAPRKEWVNLLIPIKSYQSQLIAELISGDFGFSMTTHFLNQYREENDEIPVGRSTVYKACKRLQPSVNKILKRQQGSLDLDSDWCMASHRWATQLLIMFDHLKPGELPSKFLVNGKIPACFDKDLIRRIVIECIHWWDETHKKQRVGKLRSGTKLEWRFKLDANGTLDLENGTVPPRSTELKMKYTKEARFATGMCMEIDDQGAIVHDDQRRPLGKTLPIFEYSEQKIVSHFDYLSLFEQEIQAGKHKADRMHWVNNPRVKGESYKDDCVTTLPHIGKAGKKWLLQCRTPVKTVAQYFDFFYMKQKNRKRFVKDINGMSSERQLVAEARAQTAKEGSPKIVDHRKAKNPYWSLYGKDGWKAAILNSTRMKAAVDIRVLVTHMVECGVKDYRDTVYQNVRGFYHDALSLMTPRENVNWMRTQDYLKYWILPQFWLNSHFPYYKSDKMPGNHARAMPWDHSCNKDHDDIVLRHVAATYHLPVEDPRKFSLGTPKTVSSAYRRVYNNPPVLREGNVICPADQGGPAPHRLGHDIMEVPKYWRQVFDTGGLNVQGNVQGHRGDVLRVARKEGRVKSTHGGKRVKKTVEEVVWYHPDAREAMDAFFKKEEEKYLVVLQKLQDTHGEMTLPKQPEMDMVVIVDGSIRDGNPPPAQYDDDDSTQGSECSSVSSDEEE